MTANGERSGVLKCKHGHDCFGEATADSNDKTSCCNAYWSIGDYGPYCKCCYAEIDIWRKA